MRNLLLGLCSAAVLAVAGFVGAQTTSQEQPPRGSMTATPVPTATTSDVDRDTRLRLAKMDTSPAAFRKLDKDGDGRISPLEAAENPKVAAAFTMADRDKDGYLSREEFEALGSSAHPSSDEDASSPSGDRASDPQPKPK